MANKLAPYKDPKVIASMRQFNDEYKITVQEYGMWTGEAHWPMYKHYLTWIVENNNDEDNILLDLALNKPQFDKAFRTYMRIWMSEQHITTG